MPPGPPAPGAVVPRAAAVALVDDDEVEDVLRVGAEQALARGVLGERLADREGDLPTHGHLAGFDLAAGVAEGGGDAVLGLVHQDVAVGEVEDRRAAMGAVAVPERPADLQPVVLPVRVARVASMRRWPFRIAATMRLAAARWS